VSNDGADRDRLYAAAEAAHVALGEAQQAYHERAAARDGAFHRLWTDGGVTQQEIADHFGISKGRVGQMIARHKATL
jgi:hypothetical protein